jgi:hypothetical protein
MPIAPTFTLAQAQSLIRVLDSDLARRREVMTGLLAPGDERSAVELGDLEEARALLEEALRAHPEP